MYIRIRLQEHLKVKAKALGEDHISYGDVSRATGLSRRVLSSYVTGRAKGIQFEKLMKLCEYFDCKPGELFKLVEK